MRGFTEGQSVEGLLAAALERNRTIAPEKNMSVKICTPMLSRSMAIRVHTGVALCQMKLV